MAQQTAVMKLLAWMDEQGYHVEYEMEQSFIDIEREQIESAYFEGANDMRDRKYIGMHEYYDKKYNKI
jgi:hypothetical protein